MRPEGVSITGVLLAGGLGRRFGGGDKFLNELGGRPILDQVVERALPQVDHLILNVNGDMARFEDYGLPLVPDVIDGYAGPLVGVLTGMEWSQREVPETNWLISFASDAPFFPMDMASRLIEEVMLSGVDMVCAMSNGRTHPVFAIWPIRLVRALRDSVVNENMRKIDRWTSRYNIRHLEFDVTSMGVDPFFNINCPEDLLEAENLLQLFATESVT